MTFRNAWIPGIVLCVLCVGAREAQAAYRSCKAIRDAGASVGSGIYTIDPDGPGPLGSVDVVCDMERDGGGWTLGVKTWYLSGAVGFINAVGTVADGLTHKGNPYKLDDEVIRAMIGPSLNFDVLADQSGYNALYSTGNYEYVVLRNFTGFWTFGTAVIGGGSSMQSYRASDGALAWSNATVSCGRPGHGINCEVLGGINPAGGAGCTINMGTQTNPAWHHFFMANTNTDSYLYICNGAQHSSGQDMNHRFWFRERVDPLPTCDIQMSQAEYTVGEIVAASTFRFTNYHWAAARAELKVWLGLPTGEAISIINAGATGDLVFPPGLDVNPTPVNLFTVSSSLPFGQWQFGCRILDPVTGKVWAEDLNTFIVH